MIFRHKFRSNSTDIFSTEDFSVGEIWIDGKDLFCKSLNSDSIHIRKGYGRVVDFPEWEERGRNDSLTTFLTLNRDERGEVKIVVRLPFFYLRDIGGSRIENPVENSYLGFRGSGEIKLGEVSRAEFKLEDLADINFNNSLPNLSGIELSARSDGYALTYIHDPDRYNSGKDPYRVGIEEALWGYWTLRPEVNRLLDFDDIYDKDPIENLWNGGHLYLVLRAIQENPPNVLSGYLVELERFKIEYDFSPKLGGELDCDSRCIFNQSYRTNLLKLENNFESISLDLDEYQSYILSCGDGVYGIKIGIIENLSIGEMRYMSLTIENFRGIVEFSSEVRFENGEIPIRLGESNIYNLMIYREEEGYRITVLQKSINLAKV